MIMPHWLRRLSRTWFVAGRSARQKQKRQAPQSRRPRTRLMLEGLEERVVPSTFEVVPAGQANNTTTFATLAGALAVAHNGDTIQIEPGSTPGGGTVTQNNLIIQGDPVSGAAGLQTAGTQLGDLTLEGNNDTVTNLFLANVFIGTGKTGETVSNSILKAANVQQIIGSGFTDGGDTITGNTFLGGAAILGDPTSGSSSANDAITNNVFTSPTGTNVITAQNETSGLVISGNQITGTNSANPIIAIDALDSTGVISGNQIQLAANSGSFGIVVQNTNSLGNPGNTNVAIDNNTVNTSGAGIGIATTDFSSAASLTASIAGNVLTGNNIGIKLFGNNSGSADDYGNVSIGGSNGAAYSAGGNNLSGYSGSNGNFAIQTTDGGKAATNTVIPAEHNLFGVANPQTVVFADTNTKIDTNNPITGVKTTANNESATFSNGSVQTLTLTASVTDPLNSADIINGGTVAFTVKDSNGNIIGHSVSAPVINGRATANNYILPAGQAAGTYTIAISYSDPSLKYGDLGDTSGTLLVSPADVVTRANPTSAVFSTAAQTINLSATVTDISHPSDTVTEGMVLFTVADSHGNTIGTVQGTVSGGRASTSFGLPGGQAAAVYTISVGYTESKGNFTDGGDTSSTLTIAPAAVKTTANTSTTVFSTQAQTVSLSATVADTSNPAETVNEGRVTFTLKDSNGNTIGSPVSGAVSGDTASADYTLPAGQTVGGYTIAVHYADGNGNFTDSGDTNSTLTVISASPSIQLLNVSVAPNLFSFTATETLTAHVSSVGNSVHQGTVTFSLAGKTLSASVNGNGDASVQVTLPLLGVFAPQGVGVSYGDASGDLTSAGAGNTLRWLPINAILPSTDQLATNGSQTIDVLGSLLTFSYDPQGRLTALSFEGIQFNFIYNDLNELTQVTVNGTTVLQLFYGPQGQPLSGPSLVGVV